MLLIVFVSAWPLRWLRRMMIRLQLRGWINLLPAPQLARRFSWTQLVLEAKDYNFHDWPLEGPLSTAHLLRHFEKFGGDPKRWLAEWMRAKQVNEGDRINFAATRNAGWPSGCVQSRSMKETGWLSKCVHWWIVFILQAVTINLTCPRWPARRSWRARDSRCLFSWNPK